MSEKEDRRTSEEEVLVGTGSYPAELATARIGRANLILLLTLVLPIPLGCLPYPMQHNALKLANLHTNQTA